MNGHSSTRRFPAWPARGSIRVRLTVWYAFGLTVFLAASAVASYVMIAQALSRRTDTTLRETARAFAAAWATQHTTVPRRVPAPWARVRGIGAGDLEIVVFDHARNVVAASANEAPWVEERANIPARPALAAALEAVATSEGAFKTLHSADGARRVFVMPLQLGTRRQIITVAQGLGGQDAMLDEVRNTYAIAIPIMVTLALVVGVLLAGRALSPVGAMAAQARRISVSTLHERLDTRDDRDELGQLARVFNELLDRLDRAFDQQRQFVADASHELRTPVTLVRGEAEVALARPERDPSEYREALELIHDEARRMSRLVEDLFLLARADAGHHALSPEELYLDELVVECVTSLRTLASAQGVELWYELEGEMPYLGDPVLLRRLVINLIENAVKYGAPAWPVTIRAGRDNAARYFISVHNRGQPIPPELQPRVFDRFFRGTVTNADSRFAVEDTKAGASGGAGLGLAISQWIAAAHGGNIRLARSDAGGTEFEVTLPSQGPNASSQRSVL